MITENGTEQTETLSTETVDNEVTIEDSLYDNGSKEETPVDGTKEETEGIEKVEGNDDGVKESEEEDESGETGEDLKSEAEIVEYNLKLREDSILDSSILEGVEAFARENNLSKDLAEGLLNTQEELLSNFVKMKTDENEAQKDNWREEIINDKNLGGENLKTTTENAKRAVNNFGTPEFINMLRETGYGDNIEVVRFFSKIGSMMSDDSLVNGKEHGGEKPVEDFFYGSN